MENDLKARVIALRDEKRPDLKSVRSLETAIGLSNGTLKKWETARPTADKLQKTADFFNVSVDYLLGNTEEMRSAHGNDDISEPVDLYTVTEDERERLISANGQPISDDDWAIIKAVLAKYPKKG